MTARPAITERQPFRYMAADARGRLHRGVIHAMHQQDARARLVAEQLTPIEIRVQSGARRRLHRVPDADLAFGLRVLADLLAGGLPLLRSLDHMEALVPASWHRILPRVTESVRAGETLSASLVTSGARIPAAVTGLIRAGERGSGLAASIGQAADHMESTAATRSAMIAALAYPAFLTAACVAASALLVLVVLPRFSVLLTDLGRPLPASTRLLLDVSVLMARLAPFLSAAAVVGLGAMWYWMRTSNGRLRWHEMLLRVPVVGGVRHAWASAHLCATAGALLGGGVTLLAALDSGGRASGDAAVEHRTARAADDIRQGRRPSDALEQHHAVTRACVMLIRTAEETGKLGECMTRAAHLERLRAGVVTQRFIRLLEPSLVLLFGGAVAFIAASLLQAVYSARPLP
jgi:general secretion pathway protein F